jgi:hypothetical protein
VSASLAVDNQTERVDAELVSGNFFTMLGVKPAVGRVFSSQEDDRVYNGHPVVVLSHDYWTNRFQSDPKVVGRKILVNNYPMIVVGVSAAGFSGLDPTASPDIRVPILMQPTLMPSMDWLKMSDRRQRWVQVFARLKPGYTAESAEPAMQGLFLQIRQHEMTLPAAKDWTEFGRAQFMKGRLKLTDPENLLETGIEVEAKPSGKNVKKLSLLSGGERSLTALAYLFAVFRSRPSPFYVMDEVEAALDDVNLHRFLGLIHEFRREAQLLVVSHQKRTMEAGDSLLGVTMQPGGSSKVITERVSTTA